MAVQISPSILAADFTNLASEVARIPGADWVHVDVMDNHFVPNLTIGLPVVEQLAIRSTLPLDCHLMIEDPDRWATGYAEAGARNVTFHAEAARAPLRLAREIRAVGSRTGLALRPATPVDVYADLLSEIDMLLVMTVEPGFGGQEFLDVVLPKVRRTRELIKGRDLDVWLQVDGGVSPETIERCAEAGADVFVAGSAVFRSDDPDRTVARLRAQAELTSASGLVVRRVAVSSGHVPGRSAMVPAAWPRLTIRKLRLRCTVACDAYRDFIPSAGEGHPMDAEYADSSAPLVFDERTWKFVEARLAELKSLQILHPKNDVIRRWAPDIRRYSWPIVKARCGLEDLLEVPPPGPTTSHVAHVVARAQETIQAYRKHLDALLAGKEPFTWPYSLFEQMLQFVQRIRSVDDGWPVCPWTPLTPDFTYLNVLAQGKDLVVFHSSAALEKLKEYGVEPISASLPVAPTEVGRAPGELLFVLKTLYFCFNEMREKLPPAHRAAPGDIFKLHERALHVVHSLAATRSLAALVHACAEDLWPPTGPPDQDGGATALPDSEVGSGGVGEIVHADLCSRIEQLVAVIDPLLEDVPAQYAENVI